MAARLGTNGHQDALESLKTKLRAHAAHRQSPDAERKLAGPGAIAQLGERLVRNQEVVGSSPTSSTTSGPAWRCGIWESALAPVPLTFVLIADDVAASFEVAFAEIFSLSFAFFFSFRVAVADSELPVSRIAELRASRSTDAFP